MKEVTGLAEVKVEYARRIKDAITEIRRQVPGSQADLDRLSALVTPGCAYDGIGEARMPVSNLHLPRTRTESKYAVVLHEIGQAIQLYWTLIRTDDVVGLDHLVQRLKDYAEYGFENCELLGGPDHGYGLYLDPNLRCQGRS